MKSILEVICYASATLLFVAILLKYFNDTKRLFLLRRIQNTIILSPVCLYIKEKIISFFEPSDLEKKCSLACTFGEKFINNSINEKLGLKSRVVQFVECETKKGAEKNYYNLKKIIKTTGLSNNVDNSDIFMNRQEGYVIGRKSQQSLKILTFLKLRINCFYCK